MHHMDAPVWCWTFRFSAKLVLKKERAGNLVKSADVADNTAPTDKTITRSYL